MDAAVGGGGESAGFLGRVRHVVIVSIFGLLLAWIAPLTLRDLESKAQKRPLAGIGRGVIAIAVLLAQALGVLIVVIGLGLAAGLLKLWSLLLPTLIVVSFAEGILLAGFWIFGAFVAPASVSLMAGRAILGRAVPDRAGGLFLPLAAGLSVFAVLVSVPYLGVLVHLLVLFLGLGAFWLWLFNSLENLREPVSSS